MKRIIVLLELLFGGLAGYGASSIFGSSIIGVGVMLLSVIGPALGAQMRLRNSRAEVLSDFFDHLVDRGHPFEISGKAWRKGCRISPETGEVIWPAEAIAREVATARHTEAA
jgi:hypothetical protein